jgi:hypothetical protein
VAWADKLVMPKKVRQNKNNLQNWNVLTMLSDLNDTNICMLSPNLLDLTQIKSKIGNYNKNVLNNWIYLLHIV